MGFYRYEIINSSHMMCCRLVIPPSLRVKPPKDPSKSEFLLKLPRFNKVLLVTVEACEKCQ